MKGKIIGILVVMLLIATVIPAVGTMNENDFIERNLNPFNNFNIKHKTRVDPYRINIDVDMEKCSFGTDVQITSSQEDEGHPHLTMDNKGNPIIVYDHNAETYHDVYMQKSDDFGQTWPNDLTFFVYGSEENGVINPVVDMYDGRINGGIIIQSEDAKPYFYGSGIIDITNPSSWEIDLVDNTEITPWMGEVDAACSGEKSANYCFISDLIFEDINIENTIQTFWFKDMTLYGDPNATGNVEGLYYTTPPYFSHPSVAVGNEFHTVVQRDNDNGAQIAFVSTPVYSPTFQNATSFIKSISRTNLTYPIVAASGEYAYCVVQNDRFDSQDIICYTPAGGFQGWGYEILVDSPDDEIFPSVAANGENVICTFIKEGNLYYMTSRDAGESWTEPIQINDVDGTVVEEYKATDIDGPYIIWTDNRNGNQDIFIEKIEMPWIDIQDVRGGFGVSATVDNIGSASAHDVPWSIDIEGDYVFYGSQRVGSINAFNHNSEEETIISGFVFGFGPVLVKVNVGGETTFRYLKMLGPFVY